MEIRERAVHSGAALSLLIKPASALCDLRCRYCFYRETARTGPQPMRLMTRETACMLIEKIFESDPASVSVVFQGGEPTLAGLPFFTFFTAEAARRNRRRIPVRYGIQTNGVSLNDDWAAFFRRRGFLVGLSLDGDRELNDLYRRSAAGESVFADVLRAAGTLRRGGAPFNILSVVTDETAGQAERIYTFFKNEGFRFLQFIPLTDAGCGVTLSAERYALFLKTLFDLWYRDLENGIYISIRQFDNYVNMLRGRPPENCGMRGECGRYFVVEADGEIYPCDFYCTREYRLGSVFDETPFEPGETQRRFIMESRRIRESCAGCGYENLCRGGCRRDRTEDLTKNRYCEAYRAFFDYAGERLEKLSREF